MSRQVWSCFIYLIQHHCSFSEAPYFTLHSLSHSLYCSTGAAGIWMPLRRLFHLVRKCMYYWKSGMIWAMYFKDFLSHWCFIFIFFWPFRISIAFEGRKEKNLFICIKFHSHCWVFLYLHSQVLQLPFLRVSLFCLFFKVVNMLSFLFFLPPTYSHKNNPFFLSAAIYIQTKTGTVYTSYITLADLEFLCSLHYLILLIVQSTVEYKTCLQGPNYAQLWPERKSLLRSMLTDRRESIRKLITDIITLSFFFSW